MIILDFIVRAIFFPLIWVFIFSCVPEFSTEWEKMMNLVFGEEEPRPRRRVRKTKRKTVRVNAAVTASQRNSLSA